MLAATLVVAGCANDAEDAGGGGNSAAPGTSASASAASSSASGTSSGPAGSTASSSGSAAPAAPSGEPIVVGGTLGLTGAYSGPSAGYKAAYDYWAQQVNAGGGLLGRPVEMRILDDESNATTAQQLYQTLINDDQVDLLLAPYTTAVGGAVVPITERAGKVLWDGGFTGKELHSKSKWIVTSWPYQEPEFPRPFFDYLKTLPEDQKPKTLALLTAQNPFPLVARDGLNGEGGVLNYAAELGIEVVYSQEYAQSATDLTSLVQGAKDSGAEALVALSLPNDGSLIAQTVEQVDYNPNYYCQCGSQVTTLPSWPDLGSAGINVMATTTAWPTEENEGLAELSDAMLTQFGWPALPAYAAVGYSILQVMQQAVEGTGQLEDQQALRDYVSQNEFNTAIGDITYNPDGTVAYGALLVQYQQDGNVVLWPEDVATGEAVVPLR
jgi:branched-chain amino acid transport system substrate-binding protein